MTRLVPFALLVLLLPAAAHAQQFKANITGTVTDTQVPDLARAIQYALEGDDLIEDDD